jgi:hypothetical protein
MQALVSAGPTVRIAPMPKRPRGGPDRNVRLAARSEGPNNAALGLDT